MKTLFKINSATQQAADFKIGIIKKVMGKCSIDYDRWVNLVFELGCRYAEQHITDNKLCQALLTNPDFYYWDWWLITFIEDDETLLQFPKILNPSSYTLEKERLLRLMDTADMFDRFLKSNNKLNEFTKI